VRPSQPRGRAAALRDQQARARAEAAVSRAIVSLERKKLVVREHNPRTGRTLLLSPDRLHLPDWEEMARAEEDLAAHAIRVADSWISLARRAQKRAALLRAERTIEGTEAERRADLEVIDRMQADSGRES
jgi:DNA-binding MarR family transcriptional regulator